MFDHRCENCNHKFEEILRKAEDNAPCCPKCGSVSVRRELSAPSFHLKGSGWAKDGYR